MRKNFGAKPYSYTQPVHIIATYDENGQPNAMNAAWSGICASNQIMFHLSTRHKTVKNIISRKAFTVSIGNEKNMLACDYVGVVSGNNEPEKFAKAGFTPLKSEFVDAPLIAELPMALDCKLISFDESTGILLGEIVNVNADVEILDNGGKIDPKKLCPIIFDPVNNDYLTIGKKAGNAFEDGKTISR